MDPQRFRQAYARLERLDERLTYKLRPRSGGSFKRPTLEQLDDKMRDLAHYTLELKEVLDELFQAIAAKPASKAGGGSS